MDPICEIIAVGKRYTLRPTLGAAIRLHARHGMETVVRGLVEFRLSIVHDVLRACLPEATEDEMKTLMGRIIRPIPHPAHRELFGHIALALIGFDPEAKSEDDEHDAKPTTDRAAPDYSAAYRNLFKAACGVLRWTPAEAYAATPLEIALAIDGYVEAHGGKATEAKASAPSPEILDAQARNLMARWGAVEG